MPIIEPFAGLRYDLGHVGSLSNVVAPPYDVIDEGLQNALYEKHPANVIRLILNRSEPGDVAGDEVCQLAISGYKSLHTASLRICPDVGTFGRQSLRQAVLTEA